MIILCLAFLYGLLFVSDIAVVTYPLRRYVKGTLNATTFNTQKKITFYSRGLNFAILPVAGLVVDLNPEHAEILKLVFWMISSSVVSLLMCIFYFKMKYPNLKVIEIKHVDYWNLFYCIHYIGLPCVIYFASVYNEYRATIMQFSTILNFISNFIIIWKVDYTINGLIDTKYPKDNSMQYLMNLIMRYFQN